MLRYALLFCLFALPLKAETRAVLVGVGDYAHLDVDLQGPPNDVVLMAGLFERRGVALENMVALTDAGAALPEGLARGLPNRTDILAALDKVIEESRAGDTVLFYFSGHGAQAPDTDGDEGGGMDEIFLPRDAKGWNGASGEVTNAIRDDEFGQRVKTAAAKGLRLVAILDACHSGTGFRALPQANAKARARYVSPQQLGVPEGDDTGAAEAPPPSGDYVFLYAAQSDQRAFEHPVGEAGVWYGDFTRTLAEALDRHADLTYELLVETVAGILRGRSGHAIQTPDLEGTLASEPVFGGTASGPRMYRLSGQTIQAGLLDGLTVGSELTLYASDTRLGPQVRATVTAVRARDADFEVPEEYRLPAVSLNYASITSRALDLSLKIGATLEAELKEALQARLDFELAPAEAADHLLVKEEDAYVLLTREGDVTARITPDGADPTPALAARLTALAGYLRLEQAIGQVAAPSGALGFSLGGGLRAEFSLRPVMRDGGACRKTGAAPESAVSQADASDCDVLEILLRNATLKMQDVTVLYVSSQKEVSVLWPSLGLSNRLEKGAEKRLRFRLEHSGPAARESVLVLSVPADPGETRTVFAGLASRAQTRAASGALADLLAQATRPGTASRSFTFGASQPSLGVTRLDLTLRSDAASSSQGD